MAAAAVKQKMVTAPEGPKSPNANKTGSVISVMPITALLLFGSLVETVKKCTKSFAPGERPTATAIIRETPRHVASKSHVSGRAVTDIERPATRISVLTIPMREAAIANRETSARSLDSAGMRCY